MRGSSSAPRLSPPTRPRSRTEPSRDRPDEHSRRPPEPRRPVRSGRRARRRVLHPDLRLRGRRQGDGRAGDLPAQPARGQPPRPRALLGRAAGAERRRAARSGSTTSRGRSRRSTTSRPRPGRAVRAGALGGASDHGVSKSLYGRDPDGNEFEIMWRVPREAWGEDEHRGAILPLDIEKEVARFGDEHRRRQRRAADRTSVASATVRRQRLSLPRSATSLDRAPPSLRPSSPARAAP